MHKEPRQPSSGHLLALLFNTMSFANRLASWHMHSRSAVIVIGELFGFSAAIAAMLGIAFLLDWLL